MAETIAKSIRLSTAHAVLPAACNLKRRPPALKVTSPLVARFRERRTYSCCLTLRFGQKPTDKNAGCVGVRKLSSGAAIA
jgi:hypothetical protein